MATKQDEDYRTGDELIVPISSNVEVIEDMGMNEDGSRHFLRVWSHEHRKHYIIATSSVKEHYRPVSGVKPGTQTS